ncbi:ankyrin repeat domain-containing protein 50-like isoform X1 [Malaclemys terrapin pileata]|uniref:ankyrin repeat domain-containing protein 50-like isoform X1 n=2 Tax=Malaclemys terrapin pileata TaxID=2991368 RepID=UPI0023A8D0F4|nr:ankyrin repeat domain-containing protein 50-like isoform X1 [Malaclemys terrapin pileata]
MLIPEDNQQEAPPGLPTPGHAAPAEHDGLGAERLPGSGAWPGVGGPPAAPPAGWLRPGMEGAGSRLRGKPFYCREWALQRLVRGLARAGPGGLLLTGGPGCGKTALCTELLWPTSEQGRQAGLGARALGWHFCQAHDAATLSPHHFLRGLVRQMEQCPLLPGYGPRLRQPGARASLEPAQCGHPDEAFKRAVLLPLLDLPPPPQRLLLLVDAVDAGGALGASEWQPGGPSTTIAQLLATHHHLLPPWLLLVCSSRPHGKALARMFAGFRRICLDDLRRAPVVRDVQRYILCRLEQEEGLRRRLTHETAEMLKQLHIKSNGCVLYLERVLDGVAEGSVALREIRHIPGTLNGLYLWLCQRLFTGKLFARVRPLLNVLVAAPRPLCPHQLHSALWARQAGPGPSWEEFQRQLDSLAMLLLDGPGSTRILFHASFAEWLLDVKYCTQRYLCSAAEGHGLLALSAACRGPQLSPREVHDLARHLLRADLRLPPCQLALWMVWQDVPVAHCLLADLTTLPLETDVLQLLVLAGARLGEREVGAGALLHQALEREDSVRMLLENGASANQRDANGRTLLASAAHSGNPEVASLLLGWGAEVEAPDRHGQTPLTLAALQGHAKVLHCLLAHSANVNHADRRGWTALRSAAWGGHTEAVGTLLRAGADVDWRDVDDRTVLRAAAWGGHEGIVRTLLAHGAQVNRADTEGRTALIAAAYMGHREITELLLAHGADIDHADADGRTALSLAALCVPASRGHADVVSLLLERGAHAGHRDRHGMTPLLVAACEGHTEVAELLLEGGADMEQADAVGRTPLLVAAAMGHSTMLQTLLLWGAAVDVKDAQGRTALSLAAAQGNKHMVQALLERGLDKNHPDAMGWSPLHLAACKGHAGACGVLAEHGARLDQQDRDGRTPLILAAQEGHGECVRLLLGSGSPVDHQDHDGRMALGVAALGGHRAMAKLLLRHRADPNLPDAAGRPLVYLLVLEGCQDLLELLLASGSDPEARDAQGRTALHASCWQGRLEAARALVHHGADVNALDTEQRSALHLAAWQGHASTVRFLLERGAHVDQACSQGATALGIAAQEGHSEVAWALLEMGADPTHTDRYGRTPSHVAARRGEATILRLLQSHRVPTATTCSPPGASGHSSASPPAPTAPSQGPSSNSPQSTADASLHSSRGSTCHSLATAQTVPADSPTFTQQLQHSLPRSRPAPAPKSPQPSLALPGAPEPQAGSPGREVPSPGWDPKPNGLLPWQDGGPTGTLSLLSLATLDPQLHLKRAVKLQFEGPTCCNDPRKETPL